MSTITKPKKSPAASGTRPGEYVRPSKFEELTGYSTEAVSAKIRKGVWLEGYEYIKAPDGNILIIMEGFYAWAAGQRQVA